MAMRKTAGPPRRGTFHGALHRHPGRHRAGEKRRHRHALLFSGPASGAEGARRRYPADHPGRQRGGAALEEMVRGTRRYPALSPGVSGSALSGEHEPGFADIPQSPGSPARQFLCPDPFSGLAGARVSLHPGQADPGGLRRNPSDRHCPLPHRMGIGGHGKLEPPQHRRYPRNVVRTLLRGALRHTGFPFALYVGMAAATRLENAGRQPCCSQHL